MYRKSLVQPSVQVVNGQEYSPGALVRPDVALRFAPSKWPWYLARYNPKVGNDIGYARNDIRIYRGRGLPRSIRQDTP
jgi:hypothetical protein